ncbi:TetR/AcrR family transcriptional regulator C-terminal domain-containing protein [Streptomyces rubellomurinus]|uniref:TetR/AcrR family transcriptional regulator C-terminal domain-containing protein n=1 Tax=Streptomyces rubellomurinus (strain ATCC 31215) TaxID=359131 RepID=UPI0005F111FF|nr:TetR/AcrR family transcriptional regulator C-terminal domain-containing protein [Streptomyces rubellomurinus]
MTGRRTRPRSGLTREKIIDAALAHVDQHGLAALSNRKLGAALGVEGMTLYYYVPSKAALLDGMAERLLELSAGDLFTEPAGPWTETVRDFAVALRRMLLAHPGMLTVLATRPVATPAATALLERGITVLVDSGVELADAVDVLNSVVQWTLGHTLAEAGRTPYHEGTEPAPEQLATLDADTHPHLARAFSTGAGLDQEARFHRTLAILLAGYAAEFGRARGDAG